MDLKFVEEKGSTKRDNRHSKARNQKSMRCNLLEAIAQVHGGDVVSCKDEDGTVKVKIVVKKKDLKHMLDMICGGSNHSPKASTVISAFSSILTLEQRLTSLRRRHQKRPENPTPCRSSWSPALQSIPEEL